MSRGVPQQHIVELDAVAPGTEQVRAELRRILRSEAFDASERNKAFLDFVVEETLAGRSQYIKGYTVARSVFHRDSDFDPQLDPVVRIEASRLRRSLERYYLTSGKADAIRIELPKGGYVPRFAIFEEPDIARETHAVSSALEKVSAGAAPVVYCLPSIVVFPFDNLSGDADLDLLSKGLAEELITRLTLRREFDVIATEMHTKLAPFFNRPKIDRGLAFAIAGSLRKSSCHLWVHARLVDVEHGSYSWAE